MLGKLSVSGRPTSFDDSRARACCACSWCGWGCFDIFTLIYSFSFLSPSLWEMTRYRLKYCLKGSLSPKTTNQQIYIGRGWSGGAMVLGKLPVPGHPTVWITVGQGPTALAVDAGGGCLDIFTLICPFSPFSLSLGDGPI